MRETGLRNGAYGADKFGFKGLAAVHWNLTEPALYEHAIAKNEGTVVHGGAFCAETGVHTGRSPKDKFVVCDEHTEATVWWEKNGKLTPAQFDLLFNDFLTHAQGKEIFAQDLYGGADAKYRIKARVYTELAWHSMFIRALLIRPERAELAHYVPDFTIFCLPSFKADPKRHGVRSETVIAINFTKRIILIGGTDYAGEIKKSVFTTLNYYLPAEERHADALLGQRRSERRHRPVLRPVRHRQDHALGRPEPHADRRRRARLGPAAACSTSRAAATPSASSSRAEASRKSTRPPRFGTVLENVVFDPETRVLDFDDDSLTENTRAAYPLEFIPNASTHRPCRSAQEHHHADLRRLRRAAADRPADAGAGDVSLPVGLHRQGRRHRERRRPDVAATFSTCFGAPFLPRHPSVYGNLLRELIGAHGVDCWLVNTGWTGGALRRRPAHAD